MIARPALVIALASLTACGDTTPPPPDDVMALSADPPVPFRDEKPPDTTTLPPTTTTTAPPSTVAAVVVEQPERVGSCAGWEDLIAVHFPAEQVGTACRVMMCETGQTGDPASDNPSSTASGLFQLLELHAWRFESFGWSWADRYDPAKNTAVAASLWRESGWSPWVCAS